MDFKIEVLAQENYLVLSGMVCYVLGSIGEVQVGVQPGCELRFRLFGSEEDHIFRREPRQGHFQFELGSQDDLIEFWDGRLEEFVFGQVARILLRGEIREFLWHNAVRKRSRQLESLVRIVFLKMTNNIFLFGL